ncbi:hypothetical protein UPYG_G00202350 [Umbra pygmaea]|uniref:V-set and transmembrane domain-containing protein 5 n=1 Tax=Umbra pygmaea TaxID=75934 RepID=A0ABD0X6D0_UMBPY
MCKYNLCTFHRVDGSGLLMWLLNLWNKKEVTLFLSFTLCLCQLAGSISILSPQWTLTRSVQQDVLFSVDISCTGIYTVEWTFMSDTVKRDIGAWQHGVVSNVSEEYINRVNTYTNGSLGLLDLRLQDAGFYIITVTEQSGNSKDAGFVLKVEEVLYEDLQYLSVFTAVLATLAGLLMVSMWLTDKAYRQIKASCKKKMPENCETELQVL